MRISVIPGREIDNSNFEVWRKIQQDNPSLESPYFCPHYTMLAAKTRDDIYVGVIEDNNKVLGFFPFQRRSDFTAGPVSGPLSDYHGLITEPELELDVKDMLRQCGLKSWQFNHLIDSQTAFKPFHEISDRSYLIDLSSGVTPYMQAQKERGSKLVNNLARKKRKLEREKGPVSFEQHKPDSKVMSKLFAWKAQQYIDTDLVNVFDFEWTRNLLERICSTQDSDFAGALSALYAGDELVAVHMGMRSRYVWHWWFPTYNREFSAYSPGSILLMEMIESSTTQGIRTIDLGKDRSRYKDQFSNATIGLAEGIAETGTLARKLRQTGKNLAEFVRNTPLIVPARIPARIIRRYRRRKKFS